MDKKLEQVFFAMLGGALAVKEKLEASQEELRVCQEKSEENARTFFNEMAQRGEQEKEHFKVMIKDILKEIVDDMNLVTKEDLEKLKKDLGG